jgi:hypothetical protein
MSDESAFELITCVPPSQHHYPVQTEEVLHK